MKPGSQSPPDKTALFRADYLYLGTGAVSAYRVIRDLEIHLDRMTYPGA